MIAVIKENDAGYLKKGKHSYMLEYDTNQQKV